MSRILVTGASGFVGRALCAELSRRGHEVVAAVRALDKAGGIVCARAVAVGDIGPETDWRDALAGAAGVVHAAGRAHVRDDRSEAARAAHTRVNVEGTRKLAQDAAMAGARRFVFLSSIKAMGESTQDRAPFSERDAPAPRPDDFYAQSKLAAERALTEVARSGSLEPVILRPPLVYGPGVGANFARLMKLCRLGLPLPLASIANRRSFIFVGNLGAAVALALEHPAAAGETFLLSDGEDVSTPELIRKIAAAQGRPARLFPFPPTLLRAAAALVGRGPAARRLLDSLSVDGRKIRDRLGWRPPFTIDQGLARTVAGGGAGAPADTGPGQGASSA